MKNNGWIRYLDYFFVTRPILFFPGWNTLLAGFLVARNEVSSPNFFSAEGFTIHVWSVEVVIFLFIFAAATGGSFILNQLQDIESDRRNKKLFLICEGHIGKKAAYSESAILIFSSLIISAILNIQAFLLILLGTIAGYFYNYPPFRYKNRPIWGLLLNILVGWIAFGMGWTLQQNLNTDFITASLPYLLFNTGLYLLTTIPDFTGDKNTDKKTFCVRFGIKNTIRTALFILYLALLTGIYNGDFLIISIYILTSYWLVIITVKRSQPAVVKYIKFVILFFSLIICFKFPLYLVLIVLLFSITKFYYRVRFNFKYPSFSGK